MVSAFTTPRSVAECTAKIALLQRIRILDVGKLADLSSRRVGIVLHGSAVDLAEHDARRQVRQRHHDLAIDDIEVAEDERDTAVLRETLDAAEAAAAARGV